MYSPNRIIRTFSIAVCGFFCLAATNGRALTLGTFQFNDSQFGDALLESDGGIFRSGHWLNIVPSDPGNPAALTGPNVDTGIGNIGGFGGKQTYRIFYNTPITNRSGMDLGIISARFSGDIFGLAVSTDGINFTPFITFGPALGVDTGVPNSYYFGAAPGDGPFPAKLFVTPVDLSLFGLAPNATISAVQITSFPQGDLIRVAGLEEQSEIVLIAAASIQRGFAIDLPLTGSSGVEDRSGKPNKKFYVAMTFNNNITSVGSATTTCGGVSTWSISGPTVTFKLVGVAHGCNESDITITANNVMDDMGNTLASASVAMGLLLGDVNGDRVVDGTDRMIVRSYRGQHTDGTNYRSDVSNDGFINASDVHLVNQQQGTSLP